MNISCMKTLRRKMQKRQVSFDACVECVPQVLSILSHRTLFHREAAGRSSERAASPQDSQGPQGSSAAAHTCLQCPCLPNLTRASIASLHTNLQHGESTMNLLTQAFTKQKESKDDFAASLPQNQFHFSSTWARFCKLALQSHHI